MKVLNDFNTTVEKALSEIDSNWRNYPGLIVCGTHTPHQIEYMIDEIHQARIKGIPFLGICFGHQLAAIEYARYELGWETATSEEFETKGVFVVAKRPEGLKVGQHDGESYWNNYEVRKDFEWKKPAHFVTCQYHPEYQSSRDNPHPLLIKFLQLCQNQ